MSSVNYYINRKRPYSPPPLRDDSDSEEERPRKRRRDVEDFPLAIKSRLQQLGLWFSELKNVHKFIRMALRSGASLRGDTISIEDEDDVVHIHDEQEEDDVISIKEIKGDFSYLKNCPLVKKNSEKLSKSKLSKRPEVNGSRSGGSLSSSRKINGSSIRDWQSPYDGYENSKLRRSQTDNLKRAAVVSNPLTDIEILLGSELEAAAPLETETDGIEILSESPCSKPKQTERSYHTSSKSSATNNSVAALNQSQNSKSTVKKSSMPKSFTANEVVRLQEKAQYKLLLQKYINESQYHRISRKPEPEEEEEEEVLPEKGALSKCHFKKEVLKQPVDSFIKKYYAPCRLLSPSKDQKNEPEVITVDDEEEEDLEIVEVKLPKYKAKYKSRCFTKEWISELRENLRAQTEERNKIVAHQERALEKIRKERLLDRLRIEEPVPVPEPEFPELTPEMEDAIDSALTGAPDEPLVKITSDIVYRKDIETLSGLKWLNDLVINSYFDLIMDRSKKVEGLPSVYAFNTFFYTSYKQRGYSSVRRWTRKIDIFSFDLNFVPIHLGVHWCLAVIDHRVKKISYYDSMGAGEDQCLDLLHLYLQYEYKDKKGQMLPDGAYMGEIMQDIPQQMNGSDCGMFTLKYAEYLSRDARITFTQDSMHYFRRRTVYELITKQLL